MSHLGAVALPAVVTNAPLLAPTWLNISATLLAVAVLVLAWFKLPWYKLHNDAQAQHVLGVAAIAMLVFRLFNTHGAAGITLHFLGATVMLLMFGPAFALWLTALTSAFMWLIGWAWLSWSIDFILTGALPILISSVVAYAVRLSLPSHLMVYVLGNAGAAGAAAMAASVLSKAAISMLLGADRDAALYLAATPVLMFAEMFFSGGIMAMIVVYRPQWCCSFDDKEYLYGKNL